MIRPRLLCKPIPTATRLLLCDGEDEILKAMLPPPPQAHPRAAATLCEGLALWLGRPLSILDPSRRHRPLGSFRDLRQLDLRGVR